MTDLIGRMLGSYQVIEPIGMGGMATVYKAYQASMDRFVAIKVLPRQLAEDPTFIGRFEQEARTLAKLEHNHILPVHDFGTQDGYTYLVMRYVGSGTLKDRIHDNPLPLPDVVDYLTQIAGALGYAHERGVIHRDVKSSNVLIGEDDHAYLTDFGIAKLTAGSSQFTGTGAVIGTPAYMSPEQCAGLPVDARSDLYSLGIVLYEMLTGRVPFDAETPVAVVFKHMQEPLPSPRAINPAVPEAVEQVVLRALAKNPDERYQTARELSDALREAMSRTSEKPTAELRVPPISPDATVPGATQKIQTPAPAARHKKRWLMIGLAAVVAAVITGILLWSRNDQPESDMPETSAVSINPTAATNKTAPSTWTIFTSTTSMEPDNRQLISTDGGLWMSSDGGLVHWAADGSSYTKYTTTDGLPYHSIQTMAMDQAGYLWIGGGSDQQGVIRLHIGTDGKPDQIELFNTGNSDLHSDYIWDLLPEADGTLLAATFGSYIEQWDGQKWAAAPTVPASGLEAIGDRVWAIHRTKDGTLWAGGPHGLMRLKGGQWVFVPLPDELAALKQEEYDVTHLHEDPADGSLWVDLYTAPEYQQYTLHLMPPTDSAHDPVWIPVEDWVPVPLMDVLRDWKGNLWMAGFDTLLLIDGETRTIFTREQGIPGLTYHALAEDKNGNIWLTTESALVQYDGKRWIPFTIDNEPPSNHLVAMAEAADGTLWVSGDFGVLASFTNGIWQNRAELQVEVQDMIMQGNSLWLATGDGLIQWAGGVIVQQFRPDSSDLSALNVFTLAFDPNQPDLLWIGTDAGLDRLNTVDGSWAHFSDLPGTAVHALHFDAAGKLWVGTGAADADTPIGITRLDGTTWTVIGQTGEPFRPEERAILSIADDGQGGLWTGTDGFLYHWDGSAWTPVTEDSGGPIFSPIEGIVSTGSVTWVASFYGGLYRLDDKGWYAFGNRGVGTVILRGLHRTSDGALWILSHDGLVRLTGDPLQQETIWTPNES